MKFTGKKAILFDLDGTLIDSAPDLALAINHMLTSIGREPISATIIRSWVGNGASVLVQRGLSGQAQIADDLDSDLLAKALAIFLEFYAQNLCIDTVTYPHVRSTLKILKAKGYQLAIVTNKPFDFIQPILDGLELNGLFELLIGGDTLEKRKPDPLPLHYSCEKLGVTVDQCVMIGDSKNDILAANAANMQSIGLSYGYNYGEDINEHNPDISFDDFADIIATFSDVNQYELTE
ncbi:phosphoglycolate phosphatase [Psychromonas sp. SR45-3]|uniref:phosphoglycolate phosphatase n=1 Tax=Psychromonas sp. SR45-3 TaxID=2760930 RepID=UPI0015FC4887|nr:phosphoglycolate phosphatase [Psychromonas sp. SR45-3]MBB1271993.1 phosphoglycolate phosphatase [Psychromonas sp. SR45-3]